jgi:hypothetical protein
LYNECISAGGDGDALWYSRFYSMNQILPLVEQYNQKLDFKFNIDIINEKTINWWRYEECIIITTDESVYLSSPSWIQFLLKN